MNKTIEYKGVKYEYIKTGECKNCAFVKNCGYILDEILGHGRKSCVEEFGKFGYFRRVEND